MVALELSRSTVWKAISAGKAVSGIFVSVRVSLVPVSCSGLARKRTAMELEECNAVASYEHFRQALGAERPFSSWGHPVQWPIESGKVEETEYWISLISKVKSEWVK